MVARFGGNSEIPLFFDARAADSDAQVCLCFPLSTRSVDGGPSRNGISDDSWSRDDSNAFVLLINPDRKGRSHPTRTLCNRKNAQLE
jgi:hypothetical protein